MTFEHLRLLPELLQSIADEGYTEPTPVQASAIPAVLSGRDVMAAAQTGTGKTAGFVLPVLQRLHREGSVRPHRIRALILTPTRELTAQVASRVQAYGALLPFRSAAVFGGVKINPQIASLRRGVDILVATPGRLLDLHDQGEVDFVALQVLVLDEADRMLDMGFIHDIERLISWLPSTRQTLLFSATFSPRIRQLASSLLRNPLQLDVAPANATADKVRQWLYPVDKKQKTALLSHLIETRNWQQVLVFARTREGAGRLAQQLDKAGLNADVLHGDKGQGARTRALTRFRQGKVRVLVATDIAARGLDIVQLPQVVNFDLPNVPEDYVHRIGRTGRAGESGRAYSLVSADEIRQLNAIEQLIGRHLAREYVDGFEPVHEVPASAALRRSHRQRRRSTGHAGRPTTVRSSGSKRAASGPSGRRRKPRAGSPSGSRNRGK